MKKTKKTMTIVSGLSIQEINHGSSRPMTRSAGPVQGPRKISRAGFGSGGFQNLTGHGSRVESGQEVFKILRVGPGHT